MEEVLDAHPSRYVQHPKQDRDFADGSEADTDVALTYAAVAGMFHVVWNIFWAYDGEPSGGYITAHCNGEPVMAQLPIIAGGPGWLRVKVVGKRNLPLTILLNAGGAGVTGHLHIEQHWVRK